MAYPSINHTNERAIADSYEDILTRKEFYTLRGDEASALTVASVVTSVSDTSADTDAMDLSFKNKHLQMHSHQLFMRNLMNPNTPYKRLLAKHSTGSGKCLGKDTMILMYNGDSCAVQDIKLGDILMGDDGKSRTVLSTTRGEEMLYRVSYKGGSFVCNESHILTLRTDRHCINEYGADGSKTQQTIDIPLLEYLKYAESDISLYGFRVPFDTSSDEVLPIKPYLVGLFCAWMLRIGQTAYTNSVLLDFQYWVTPKADMSNTCEITQSDIRDITTQKLCDAGLFAMSDLIAPCIPSQIFRGSIQQRREVIAGILDGFGNCAALITHTATMHYRCYYPKRDTDNALITDGPFSGELSRLVNSAGYVIKFSRNGRTTIRGDYLYNIPVNDEHLRIPVRYRKNTQTDPSLLNLDIEKIGHGDYYGFEITGNGRFLLADYVVTHNTILALGAANTFIENYKQRYEMAKIRLRVDKRAVAELDRETPSIFIIGFNHSVFYRTLVEFPEFGYVSIAEKEELDRLRNLASTGITSDVKRAADYYSNLTRVIKDKRKGGFFKFYGYQMLVNRLFNSDELDLTDIDALTKVKSSDKSAAANSGDANAADDDNDDASPHTQSMLLQAIQHHIRNGTIQINQLFLSQFKDSLIICDEIHNVYNSLNRNNWGVVIQYLLDYHDSLRALFLSATPISSSPVEIIDVLNLLLPADEKVQKSDFFINQRDIKPNKLAEIGRLSAGRVSFLEDINPKYYPKRIFIGDTIKLPTSVQANGWKEIPYLKFITCDMSPLHHATYVDMLDGGVLFSDGYSISDMVFPNPDNNKIGLYRSSNTKNKILHADAKFRSAAGIDVVKHSALNIVYRGPFANIKNIGKYSGKYHRLITDILAISKATNTINTGQKIMIYHERVKMSGVLMIQELLFENGFIGIEGEPTDNTICSICGAIKRGHKSSSGKTATSHDYFPARFIMAHGDMDKNVLSKNIAKFNAPNNSNGVKYKIIVGSRQIKESYEIKAVRHLMILAVPSNIPTLMQIFGRCIRKNSHLDLPPQQRDVKISIYVSMVPKTAKRGGGDDVATTDTDISNAIEYNSSDDSSSDDSSNDDSSNDDNSYGDSSDDESSEFDTDVIGAADVGGGGIKNGKGGKSIKNGKGGKNSDADTDANADKENKTIIRKDLQKYRMLSYEAVTYFKKLLNYTVIQDIEKTFHEYAIDAEIHRDTIMTPDKLLTYFPKCGNSSCGPPIASLGPLYYESKFPLKAQSYTSNELALTSFNAYGYGHEEVVIISSVIKRMFLNKPTYTYAELWDAVQNPPFQMEMNARLFSEGNFAIALTHLIEEPVSVYDKYKRRILTQTQTREITELQFVHSLFDYDAVFIYMNDLRYRIAHIGEYYILLPIDESNDLIIDIDSFVRTDEYQPNVVIDIAAYTIGNKSAYNYETKKKLFYHKYCKKGNMVGFLNEYDARFYFNILDEMIIHFITGTKIHNKTNLLYHYILEELDPFDIIIYVRDVAKYKNVAKMIRGGMPKVPPKTPIGYIKYNSIKIFDREDWIEIGKGAMNRHIQYRENRHIIGYFDTSNDNKMKFRLRKPMAKSAPKVTDVRLVETGTVCDTKNKKDLLNIAQDIKVRNFNPKKVKVRELCDLIREKLLDLEITERTNGTSIKYVYMFNERQ